MPVSPPRVVRQKAGVDPKVKAIPTIIPVIIPMIWRGIITSKAPKNGIRSSVKKNAIPMPDKPPAIMQGIMFQSPGKMK